MGEPTKRRTSSMSPGWPGPTPVWVTFTIATRCPDATASAAMAAVTTVLPTPVPVPVTTNKVIEASPRQASPRRAAGRARPAQQEVPAPPAPDLDRSAQHEPSAAAGRFQQVPTVDAGTPLARRGAGIAQP